MELIAKIFQNGRSQAVRIPKEFRFRGNEVKISKKGDKVILEPLERSTWPEGFWD
jgi:antitoxin VapB